MMANLRDANSNGTNSSSVFFFLDHFALSEIGEDFINNYLHG